MARRAAVNEELARGRFDVVVIGGGIVGAATAALAAQLGLRVALLERRDFAAGTSSASSKLVHGGLRYLRMGDFGLVREALAEAQVLRRTVAPHLVDDLDFVLPVYRDGPYGRATIRAALAAYGALTGSFRGRGRLVPPGRARELVPLLRDDGLRGGGVYPDARTNDARLCLATVRAAADAGAVVANGIEVAGIDRAKDGLVVHAHDLRGAGWIEVSTRTVVNACGPWVDDVRRLEDPRAGTSVTLSKGVHLVLERPGEWGAALTIPVDRDRVSFAIPWEGLLLLGTTDTAVEPGEDALAVTAAEQEQILSEARRALPAEAVRPEAIRSRFAGVRVLPLGGRATASARREVTFSRGRSGMLSVAGGKLTTHRLIARAALHALRTELGGAPSRLAPARLPGACDRAAVAAGLEQRHPAVSPELACHLARTYGSLAGEVLACAAERRDALEPLAAGGLDVVAQALYAREREWAYDAEDVLRRRTTLALRGLDTPALRERVRGLLSEAAPAPEPRPA